MLFALIGFFAGIIGGMGMGGGTILIPALVLLAGIDTKIAQSVNLLSSIPMTLIALAIHIKNKNVIFKLVIPIA
ncbi:TSUP family transporter, partial [Clostridioides difficile]|nr:TSUP family transporter [Clostridioides difficile]